MMGTEEFKNLFRIRNGVETVPSLLQRKYRSGYKENQYELKGIYRQRMDQFFVYNDKRNCERVYEKICEMMKL